MHRQPNLEDFPRPGVTVDLAILTVTSPGTDEATLRALVQERADPDGRVPPGRFLRERHTEGGHSPAVAAPLRRSRPRRPHVGDLGRPLRVHAGDGAARSEGGPARRVVGRAPRRLRSDAVGPRRDRLLPADRCASGRSSASATTARRRPRTASCPQPFTLHQLRKVHEAVIGVELHKDNFARRMKPQLAPVMRGDEVARSSATRGLPAALYRQDSAS
ncbi:NrtR DNA-binding winged helix domain-containing protein [Janibacter hoylei]